MTPTRSLVLLALIALPVAGLAQEAGTPAAPQAAASAVELGADLRAEYIQGEPILVRLTVRNPGDSAQSFPDLSRRPWLVRFELVYPDGKKQAWFTTPPEQDAGQAWSVAPRSQKRALLEIPSSARLKAGEYQLTVRVLTPTGELTLPPHRLRLAPASPVGGRVGYEPLGMDRGGHQVAWLHKAAAGYDLYLHHADGRQPQTTLGDYHLLHLDQAVEPVLSVARPQQRWDRWIYWLASDGGIQAVRLQAQGLRSDRPSVVRTPYPKIELVGRGNTDAQGDLHVPFWVAAPSGQGGELRVASVRERGEPRFRLVGRFERRPGFVESAVDGNGDLRLVVEVGGKLDLYTVVASSDLPAAGVRLVRDTPGAEGQDAAVPTLARFGYLPELGEEAGGQAVQVLLRTGAGVQAAWFSLTGRELRRLEPLALPAGAQAVDLLPRGYDTWALLYRSAEGELWFGQPNTASLNLGRPTGASLAQDGRGGVALRTLEPAGPVRTRMLVPGTAPADGG